ncbi:MAG: phospholipase D-like domain-containing protein [Nanoarchaeota archaeon]
MKKYFFLILTAIIALSLAFLCLSNLELDLFTGMISGNDKLSNINDYIIDEGNIQIFFCPRENCETAFVKFLDSAETSIHCALFDVGLDSVQKKLLEKAEQESLEVQIVTDDQYLKKFDYPFVKADSGGLMHNKFCIIDGKKISTGSMNPTDNCANKNNNNLLLIDSNLLTQNYEREFQEMWNGQFKKGEPVTTPKLLLGSILVQNYFCPEDHCAYRVEEELKKAEKSIYFMTFSFTNEGIANVLLLKNLDGIFIQGVMEARQISEYSQFERLLNNNINVIKDMNKNNMHHKVFIVDEETIITGSFNPTGGGDTSNDENILIIKDKEIANRYLKEFELLRMEAQG